VSNIKETLDDFVGEVTHICRKYEHLMALNGMDSSKLKSRNDQLIMPLDLPLLRKLAFSKLVDATKTKSSMTNALREFLSDKTMNCSKR
jgi:hypothetical protein